MVTWPIIGIIYLGIAVAMFIFLARKKYDPNTVWTEGAILAFAIIWPATLYGFVSSWLIDLDYRWITTPTRWVIKRIQAW